MPKPRRLRLPPYTGRMAGVTRSGPTGTEAEDPVFDDNGVDLAQVRRMLALAPEERLRLMQDFVESILEIRELNEERPLR
jgi:hypothetical protein